MCFIDGCVACCVSRVLLLLSSHRGIGCGDGLPALVSGRIIRILEPDINNIPTQLKSESAALYFYAVQMYTIPETIDHAVCARATVNLF